jgi:hypothetical protein
MPELWMPGATRHALGNEGAMNGGPARAVWHITSNDKDWTFANELGWFTGGGADVAPHLLWDPFTGEVAQFFPADSRSLSLQNDGAVKTNRTGRYCIQIEVVFTEGEIVNGKRYATVRDTPCKGLDQIMAWLRSLGIPDVWPGGAPTGFVRDTVTAGKWLDEGGHYGHNQVRGNSHIDPGPMPDLFASSPAPSTVEETDVPAPMVLNESNAADVVLPSGGPWTGLAFTDAVIHSGPRVHDTIVHLLTDPLTSATAVIEGRFYLTDTAGKNPSAYLPIVKKGGGGHQFVLSGQVPADRHLRFEARATTADGSPVTLIHRMATGLYWAL